MAERPPDNDAATVRTGGAQNPRPQPQHPRRQQQQSARRDRRQPLRRPLRATVASAQRQRRSDRLLPDQILHGEYTYAVGGPL